MTWDAELTPEQRTAASYVGSDARLLAGPGTGKTLVLSRRVQYLTEVRNVPAEEILALTFTRAAAYELCQRVTATLGQLPTPRVSTLHSFALRQLLRNSRRLTTLPQPLRVADDWEERNVILEDIKAILQLSRIDDARDLFNALSSDWETLAADQGKLTPDPRFVGAWLEHRSVFGYTLRAELVYQLKRALEQLPDFQLEAPTRHLLVDEYQDLNKCDLEVIRSLSGRGAELFVAGDDDQSIYGFRKAHPEGIRNFPQEYPGAVDLPLRECKRCDGEILRLGEFVANLDPRRIKKGTRPETGRPSGEVALLSFKTNYTEAEYIAALCRDLIQEQGVPPHEILILLRVDTYGAFSKPLSEAFQRAQVPNAIDPASRSPLDSPPGRQLLASIRLLANREDHLSWVTLLQLRRNRFGDKAQRALYEYARVRGLTIAAAIRQIANDPSLLPRYGGPLATEVSAVDSLLNAAQQAIGVFPGGQPSLDRVLIGIAGLVLPQASQDAVTYLLDVAAKAGATSLSDLLVALQVTRVDIEPEIEQGKVNVLTMHKAKGLTAAAVIIVGVEDEHIPGRQDHEPELGDERRLLFVSLTRAKRMLFLTYSENRLGQQRRLGKNPGSPKRSLTQFLRHVPLKPTPGPKYISDRGVHRGCPTTR